MSAKRKSKKDRKIHELQGIAQNNIIAMNEKKKKYWSIHDIKAIKPLSHPQKQMVESYFVGNHIVADGSAGTGKSYLSLYLALNSVLSKNEPQKKIIIVRSAVATRDIGFLPGDENEKMSAYETPYRDIIGDLLGNYNAYDNMKEAGLVSFTPTSFVRGLTWDDAVIIIDEVENLNIHEINSVVTRVGSGSRLIVVGDYIQTDLFKNKRDVSGMTKFIEVINKMPEFDYVRFTKADIVRSDLVKSWLCALEEVGGFEI